MELTLSSWFNEPKINFKFSHKVQSYIRDVIKEDIMAPLGLIESYQDKFINLNVTTEENRSELLVNIAPTWSENERSHGLFFPYHPIVDSKEPLREYLKYYVLSIQAVFKSLSNKNSNL